MKTNQRNKKNNTITIQTANIRSERAASLYEKTHALCTNLLSIQQILTTRSIQTDTGVVITTSAMQKEKQIENYCPLYAMQTTRPALRLSRQAK